MRIEPPIRTTRFSFLKVARSRSMAAPILVSGAMATSVMSSGCWRISPSRKSTAAGCDFAGGPPRAHGACENGVLLGVGRPSATGMPVACVSSRRRSTMRARSAVSPQAVVKPRISSSGLVRARPRAKASSTSSPMSVSMMIFVLAGASGDVNRADGCANCAPSAGAAARKTSATTRNIRIGIFNLCASSMIPAGSIACWKYFRKLDSQVCACRLYGSAKQLYASGAWPSE